MLGESGESEEAWIHHEIGYCFLSRREFESARRSAERALHLARRHDDVRWKFNAYLLLAQALGGLLK